MNTAMNHATASGLSAAAIGAHCATSASHVEIEVVA